MTGGEETGGVLSGAGKNQRAGKRKLPCESCAYFRAAGKSRRRAFAEFSKKVIGALIAVWFVGAVIGAAVVAVQTVRGDYMVNLSDLLLYIGAPMTGGIVSYMLKSAYENKEKIRKEVHTDEGLENETDEP